MRIAVNKLEPNRFRDFTLDPIDEEQVERLVKSIDDFGFFSGITARPVGGGMYEIAAGHHRWKAALAAGISHVECIVDDYDDDKLIAIAAAENLTQRRASTGAQMDAVGARTRVLAYEILTDRPGQSKFFDGLSPQKKLVARNHTLKDGPGEKLVYLAVNGFRYSDESDKPQDERGEMISMGDVRAAVKMLKDSGRMAKIVADAFAKVEEERAEDAAAAAEAERKAEAKRKADEEKAAAELKRQKEAEQAAEKRAAEAAERRNALEKAAREADARKKAEAERKAKEAAAAAAKAEKERIARAAERVKTEQAAETKRQQEAVARANAKALAEARAAKEAEERAKIKAQQELDRIYDGRCHNVFQDPAFSLAFQRAVTSRAGLEAIGKEQQLPLAKEIAKELVKSNAVASHKAGSEFVTHYISELIVGEERRKREAEEAANAALRSSNQRARVGKYWDDVKSAINKVDFTMGKLVEESKTWDKSFGSFPAPATLSEFLGVTEKIEEMIVRAYPDNYDVVRWMSRRGAGATPGNPKPKLIASK